MSEDLSKRIESLLLAYRTRCWPNGDDEGESLVSAFTPLDDLTDGIGKAEVSELADYLAGELEKEAPVVEAARKFAAAYADKFCTAQYGDGGNCSGWIDGFDGRNSPDAEYLALRAALASLTPTEPTK